jgi:hypothetical protein
MRIASYNVENLYERAKALSADTPAAGDLGADAIAAHGEISQVPGRGVTRRRSVRRWLSRKVLGVPVGRFEGLLCGQRVSSALGPVGVGRPESLSTRGCPSGCCDGQLVGVQLQQVVRGRDQSPL